MTNMIMTNDRHALTVGWGAPVGAPAAAPLLCVRPMAVRPHTTVETTKSLVLAAPFCSGLSWGHVLCDHFGKRGRSIQPRLGFTAIFY